MPTSRPNVIFLIMDSFRQDHMRFYNPHAPCPTPHLDRLAREGVAFDNCYPEGLPTIPVRTCWLTGERTLVDRGWQPLAPEDRSLAEILSDEGYLTGMFSDNYHYARPGMNLHRGFRTFEWVRGQEYDNYRSAPLQRFKLDDYCQPSYPPEWRRLVEHALQNLEDLETADDYYCARLSRLAGDWAAANAPGERPLFMWVDSFDPHEPWLPPHEFDRFTDPGYRGKKLILPPGGPASAHFSEAEMAYIRGLYAGECAYVDHYLGALLARLEEAGLYDQSLIVFIADHGHPLAEHGKFLKGGDRLYSELLKVPCVMRFPGGRYGGRRLDALASFHDVLPTVLDALGLGNNLDALPGRSLLPLIRGQAADGREAIIAGYHEAPDRCVRDKVWSYIRRPEGRPDELYNLQDDPGERTNLIDRYPQQAQRLAGMFGSLYWLRGAPVKGVQGKYEVDQQ
ncbi:MAG TPA: sulfatase [Anaerolineae bacterium]|nr:sulfatase [Anaerolineae bacterium]HOG45337.1 sulfatase [Anaerolineae bacterium]HOQ97241.1 sulfatase [Anaerolineae bacterium]HPL26466.1 sulfatase [Anaerolineae bacterium]